MKKYLLYVILALGVVINGRAQEADAKDGGKLEALKIAFLTKKLDLSTEEAQRFWPIYNNYTKEIRLIRVEQKLKNLPEIEVEDRILTVRKKYNTEFSKAINSEKVNTFFKSEKDFRNTIQKELQERRLNRQLNKRGLR